MNGRTNHIELCALLALLLSGCGSSETPRAVQSTGGSAGSASATGGTAGSENTSSGGGQTASGGGTTAGSSCGPSADECTAATALNRTMIDNFENGHGWYLFANPDDPAGHTDPKAGANIAAVEISCPAGGVCGSSLFAMHVSGGDYSSYGPSLSSDYVYQDSTTKALVGAPKDASSFTGIAFWARKGDTANAAPNLRLIVNDVTTHPLGGICDATASPGTGSAACWDGWMSERAIPSSWSLIKIPFADLAQSGFGKQGTAIQTDKIYGLTFQMPAQATFDFWIDDVAYYKE